MWGVDNANVPAPAMDPSENVIQAGVLTMRTKFEDYTGIYVQHCHRLNHEDNGLMALINVIPAVSTYAVAVPGSPGRPAEVKVYDGNGDRLVAVVTPFPGFKGSPSVAMGDVDGDNVLDLIVGAGKGYAPEVVVYSGKAHGGKPAFGTELTRFAAFAPGAQGGISVTATRRRARQWAVEPRTIPGRARVRPAAARSPDRSAAAGNARRAAQRDGGSRDDSRRSRNPQRHPRCHRAPFQFIARV